jgi:carbon-monoxide dehydrogenase iron sulfur subunit
MRRVYSIEELCLDCKLCEIWCKTAHSQVANATWRAQGPITGRMDPFDIIKAWKHEQPEPQERIRVEGDFAASMAVNCRHCDEPRCVEGCISGAMQQDPETHVVTCDPTRCVGCRTCVALCPFGAIVVRDVALKCDLCGDGAGSPGMPACVAACPNRALIYVESEVQ